MACKRHSGAEASSAYRHAQSGRLATRHTLTTFEGGQSLYPRLIPPKSLDRLNAERLTWSSHVLAMICGMREYRSIRHHRTGLSRFHSGTGAKRRVCPPTGFPELPPLQPARAAESCMQLTPPLAVADEAAARAVKPEALAGDMVHQLLRLQPGEDDALRPLGSKLLRGPARLDPGLLAEAVRVSRQASRRLSFTTQVPQALAVYVARGNLDLAACELSFCHELLLYLGDAQVMRGPRRRRRVAGRKR
jgi:hypothetical protein